MKIALFLLLIGNIFGNVFAQDTAPVQDNLKTPFVVAEKNIYLNCYWVRASKDNWRWTSSLTGYRPSRM